jgi:hypothetical protein
MHIVLNWGMILSFFVAIASVFSTFTAWRAVVDARKLINSSTKNITDVTRLLEISMKYQLVRMVDTKD